MRLTEKMEREEPGNGQAGRSVCWDTEHTVDVRNRPGVRVRALANGHVPSAASSSFLSRPTVPACDTQSYIRGQEASTESPGVMTVAPLAFVSAFRESRASQPSQCCPPNTVPRAVVDTVPNSDVMFIAASRLSPSQLL